MSSAQLDAMMEMSQARVEAYLHAAKELVMNNFGPATELTHTEAFTSCLRRRSMRWG